MDRISGHGHGAESRVELDRPEPQPTVRSDIGAEAPQHRVDPRLQLTNRERLGEVVVGARIQPGNLVSLLAPG